MINLCTRDNPIEHCEDAFNNMAAYTNLTFLLQTDSLYVTQMPHSYKKMVFSVIVFDLDVLLHKKYVI